MNKNQKKFFYYVSLAFTACLYYFFHTYFFADGFEKGELILLIGFMCLCGLPLYFWVKANPKLINSYFKH